MQAPRAPFTAPDQPIRANTDHPVSRVDLGVMDYQQAWDYQADLAAKRAADTIEDQYLIVEHPSVYTAGTRTQPSDRPTQGPECIDVDRGGRITWHGPGQLVVYPIIQLATPIDVVDYVRRVEEALIIAVRQLGLANAGRITGRSGVWLPADEHRPARKIAALGIRVTGGVTMHGLSLNCNNTLEFYDYIVPCGISDAGVTTLTDELGRETTPRECVDIVCTALDDALAGITPVADHTIGEASDPCAGTRKRS
ncbi:lipoyl(octanoyl) transferase LipB [Corynebacterium choanae]|uniref:Octanoyltransferase n=1 Tax=Corynebacterium choanae TaxID=1862358 RepID=A0A3G6J858_9CORY|nr:lipoyl(octanoyl) transferase LipB [Corynebacterium choanae]AZA13992.1 Octanoyltransferase [Corynebacterium choanae]